MGDGFGIVLEFRYLMAWIGVLNFATFVNRRPGEYRWRRLLHDPDPCPDHAAYRIARLENPHFVTSAAKLRGKTLLMGEPRSRQDGGGAAVLPPDKEIIYLDAFPLSRKPEPAEPETLDAEEGAGKAFLEKCLNDENHAHENE